MAILVTPPERFGFRDDPLQFRQRRGPPEIVEGKHARLARSLRQTRDLRRDGAAEFDVHRRACQRALKVWQARLVFGPAAPFGLQAQRQENRFPRSLQGVAAFEPARDHADLSRRTSTMSQRNGACEKKAADDVIVPTTRGAPPTATAPNIALGLELTGGGGYTLRRKSSSSMTKTIIKPAGAVPAVGPYNQGVRIGDLLFCAGQIPLVPATGQLVEGDIRAQAERVLENIKIILSDQGLAFTNVVKTTVFMVNLADFAAMNEVYAKYFTADFPARSTVQVAALPRGASVEIEIIAHY